MHANSLIKSTPLISATTSFTISTTAPTVLPSNPPITVEIILIFQSTYSLLTQNSLAAPLIPFNAPNVIQVPSLAATAIKPTPVAATAPVLPNIALTLGTILDAPFLIPAVTVFITPEIAEVGIFFPNLEPILVIAFLPKSAIVEITLPIMPLLVFSAILVTVAPIFALPAFKASLPCV